MCFFGFYRKEKPIWCRWRSFGPGEPARRRRGTLPSRMEPVAGIQSIRLRRTFQFQIPLQLETLVVALAHLASKGNEMFCHHFPRRPVGMAAVQASSQWSQPDNDLFQYVVRKTFLFSEYQRQTWISDQLFLFCLLFFSSRCLQMTVFLEEEILIYFLSSILQESSAKRDSGRACSHSGTYQGYQIILKWQYKAVPSLHT